MLSASSRFIRRSFCASSILPGVNFEVEAGIGADAAEPLRGVPRDGVPGVRFQGFKVSTVSRATRLVASLASGERLFDILGLPAIRDSGFETFTLMECCTKGKA